MLHVTTKKEFSRNHHLYGRKWGFVADINAHSAINLFSNPSVALPTSQLILQSFHYFTYVTVHSATLLPLLLRHKLLLLPMHRFGLLPVCETTKGTDPSNVNEVCLNLCVLVDDKMIIFLANGVQAF